MLALLWPVPFVFLTLFLSVRQDLRAQQLEKHMTADQERIETLGRRLQGLRHRLSASTTFTRLEPQARGRGLRSPQAPQVLAVGPAPDLPAAPEGMADRMMAGLVEFLGPEAAQAEDRRGGDPAAPSRAADRGDGGR